MVPESPEDPAPGPGDPKRPRGAHGGGVGPYVPQDPDLVYIYIYIIIYSMLPNRVTQSRTFYSPGSCLRMVPQMWDQRQNIVFVMFSVLICLDDAFETISVLCLLNNI